MKLMNIIISLAMIAVIEGVLHEYMWSTTTRSDRGSYQIGHRNRTAHARKKEATQGIFQMILTMIQALWAFAVGIAHWMWKGVCEWIELVLMIFECTELAYKLAERFHLG